MNIKNCFYSLKLFKVIKSTIKPKCKIKKNIIKLELKTKIAVKNIPIMSIKKIIDKYVN